jgi:tetratricopeptide (TPR) repeat protein
VSRTAEYLARFALYFPGRVRGLVALIVSLLAGCFSPANAQQDRAFLDCYHGYKSRGISEDQFIESCGVLLKRSPNNLPVKANEFNKLHLYTTAMLVRARSLMNRERFSEAISQYNSFLAFIARHPKLTEYYRISSQAAQNAGAVKDVYYLELGIAYLKVGQVGKAAESANALDDLLCTGIGSFCARLGELPGFSPSAELRGDIDMQQRQYQRAKAYYQTLVDRGRGDLTSFREKLKMAERMIAQPESPPPKVVPPSQACVLFPNLC